MTFGPANWGPPRRPGRTGLWTTEHRDQLLGLIPSLHLRELAGDDWRSEWQDATGWIGRSTPDEDWGPLAEELARAPGVTEAAARYLTLQGKQPQTRAPSWSWMAREERQINELSAQRLVAAGRLAPAASSLTAWLQSEAALATELAQRADHLNLMSGLKQLGHQQGDTRHPSPELKRLIAWRDELAGQQAEVTFGIKKRLRRDVELAHPDLDPAAIRLIGNWVTRAAINELEALIVRRSAADQWEAQWLRRSDPDRRGRAARVQRPEHPGLEFLTCLSPTTDLGPLRRELERTVAHTPRRGPPPTVLPLP